MLTPSFDFEKSLIPSDCRYLMGIDEVGRGPWAGPVTIGAFIIDLQTFDPQTFINLKIRDSKTLSEAQRQKISHQLINSGYKYQTFSASSFIIDQQGINNTIIQLFHSALQNFSGQFDYCLIDGNLSFDKIISPLSLNEVSPKGRGASLVDADARCFSVAAASIIAKVTRDADMDNFHLLYPEYDFKSNKGYGTKSHQSALQTHGPCPIHRRSFKPISTYLF